MNITQNTCKICLKAIIFINLFNVASKFIWTMSLSMIFVFFYVSENINQVATQPPDFIRMLSAFGGTIITIMSGYLCEKISRGSGYLVIFIYHFINTFISWPIGLSSSSSIVGILMGGFIELPFAFFGAWLFLRRSNGGKAGVSCL